MRRTEERSLDSWRWKIAQQSSMLSGSGGGSAKATVSDLSFVHSIDRASPNLMRYCLTGRRIPEAILTTRKAGGMPLEFLKIKLSNVVITLVEPIVYDNHYREQVSLSFSKVTQEYKLQNFSGTSAGVVTATFDIAENVEQGRARQSY